MIHILEWEPKKCKHWGAVGYLSVKSLRCKQISNLSQEIKRELRECILSRWATCAVNWRMILSCGLGTGSSWHPPTGSGLKFHHLWSCRILLKIRHYIRESNDWSLDYMTAPWNGLGCACFIILPGLESTSGWRVAKTSIHKCALQMQFLFKDHCY